MKSAVALVLLVVAGTAVGAVIVSHQRINPPSWVPVVGKSEFKLRAELTSVQGVLPGQGQAVTVSGVRVGQIGGGGGEHGIAAATRGTEPQDAPRHPNAPGFP